MKLVLEYFRSRSVSGSRRSVPGTVLGRRADSQVYGTDTGAWLMMVLFSSSAVSTLCETMYSNMPGFPVLHHLPELAQTHARWVSDAIQPSHPIVPFSSCLQSFPASGSFLAWYIYLIYILFPGGSDGKASACSAGDPCSIPGLGRSPGKGNGNPLQYSCLENSMDWGAL